MNKRFVKRKVRKRRGNDKKSKMKFVAVLAIMIMAVFLGYLTARFVIGPILGYNADESPITAGAEESSGQEDIEEGYALQFGVYSTKTAANNMVSKLREKGIETKIIEKDGLFKVISPVIKTKDEALDKLEDIKDKEVEDVFITSF